MTASIRGGIFTMAMLLKGAEVAKALTEGLHAKTEELKKNGVEPCLAILRVGAREDDLAYERDPYEDLKLSLDYTRALLKMQA